MPQNITEVPGWDAPLTAPAGADVRNSASVLAALQKVANRFGRIAQRVAGLSGSVNVEVPLTPVLNANSRFSPPTSGSLWWQQTSIADAGELLFPIFQPNAGQITQVVAKLEGGSGHSALPATKPTLEIRQVGITASSYVSVSAGGPTVDGSASVGAYEDAHSITISTVVGADLGIDETHYISFKGEAGAEAQTGLRLVRIYVVVTV